ncbi:hypothetical protein Sjap_002738 [Stephania japonica]|uniref:non-specific serine/threonine protein kinase n=1 Tax=Stephania japonica TaxID=461633 RepID=A0AAP0PSU2_9MAGN
MDPEICDSLINRFVVELYNFGLQPDVQIDKPIKFYADHVFNWSSDEEKALITLWTLLGPMPIKLFRPIPPDPCLPSPGLCLPQAYANSESRPMPPGPLPANKSQSQSYAPSSSLISSALQIRELWSFNKVSIHVETIEFESPLLLLRLRGLDSVRHLSISIQTLYASIRRKIYALNVVGEFPQEIRNLTFLTNLKMGQNYITGSVPAFIGELREMQYLDLGINALSGELPKELGNLTKLIVLGLGANNFSGPLPSELGKLASLQQLYIDSSGVSGEIPPSFANLQNLETVWASDNQLTGKIPDFIGRWGKLKSLRFQGNSFVGPIPSAMSNLTSMTDLRISDLTNGSSSLAFIRNMKSLSTLILRNNNISDTLPSTIGEYQSLTFLFLGNNQLSGNTPSQKSGSLKNIDLSYNQLTGRFPDWVTEPDLQFFLSSGLNCLQQGFPCNREPPRYSSFAINCGGGMQITSAGRILFERENATLGPASYFTTDTRRWAVSNVGRFVDSNNAQYTRTQLSQYTNTLDPELFQTARLSPGSLRYYGLGLQNGNYTVNLQFAEAAFPDTRTWQSRGRRVFDIYVQGKLEYKDFDIKKEAGASFRAVQKQLKTQVTANYLEIHLFWAGKGTCCIPDQGTYGPSVSAISATPDFVPSVSNTPPETSKNRTGLIVGICVAVGIVKLLGIAAKQYTFSYEELRSATEDFKTGNKLGEGGFGPVYKGKLSDGRVVAVKQLSVTSHQGKSQFVAEIATISAVQHRNLVKLHGCCIEGDKRLLVYEYLENKSLDQALFGDSILHLDWPTRYDVLLGTARGLAYLHEESRIRVVHRDVKASNILLDADLVPKISDFGLAKLYDDKKTHISTRVAGTIGYLAPEYAMRGHLTEKADVFGFGVVALEVLSGRPNSDSNLEREKIYLLEWAWNLHENNHELELVDPRLSEFNEEEAKRVLGVALLCTQTSPMLRPSMTRVVAMLSGDVEVSTVASKPAYLSDWEFNDITSFISEDTTSRTSMAASSNKGLPSASDSQVSVKQSPTAADPMLHDILDGR